MKQIVRGLNGEDNVVMTFSVMDAKKHFPQTERCVLGFTKEGGYAFYYYNSEDGWYIDQELKDWSSKEPDFWMDIPTYLEPVEKAETKDTEGKLRIFKCVKL